MALRRNSSQGNQGENRKEPRLFPERVQSGGVDPADAPPRESDDDPTTIDTGTATAELAVKLSEFRSRIRSLVILAWLLPAGFSIFLLLYQGIYSASDMMLVLQRFGFAYIAICTLAASLLLTRYVERIALSVTDAPDPDSVDWPDIQNRLKWFQRSLFASFAAYCTLAPFFADLVLGHARGRPFSAEEHILSLLTTAPGVIITAIPIFFRLSDLIGAFFAARGGAFVFVSIGAKVAALGLLTPLMISTALLVHYRDHDGFILMEAMAVFATLVGAAGIGTWIAWSSFRRSLAPLRISGGTTTYLDETARMTPTSLDEIGLLVRDWAKMTERDQTQYDRVRAREEQIRLITDSLPALITYVDAEERIRFVNERYRDWWQVEPDELIGKSLSEFLPPELYAKKTPRIAAALAGVETTDVNEFRYPDGKKRICEVRYVPHKCDTGTVLGYFALISDITEQRAAERTAQKAHQRLLDAIEGLPAGFSLYDEDERLVITNSLRRTLTSWHGDLLAPGVTFEELVRDSVTGAPNDGVDKDDVAAVEAFVENRLKAFRAATGKPIELQRVDGSAVVSLFHKTSDGGTVSVSLDITERKRAEQAARLADRRLRDAIESMPAGFRIFDADERLVLWNSKYEEQTRWHGGHIEAGITFDEILKKTVAVRNWIDQAEQGEDYIRHRLAEFRNPGAPYEISRTDGRHFLSVYRKTADGGTVSVMHEITDQKQAEKQAEHERRRLLDSINSLPIGFRLYDQDDRLVYSNDGNLNQISWHSPFLQSGSPYEDILRQSVAEGAHVHDMESDEAYIEYRLREFKNADGKPIERQRSDGRTALLMFRKTSDGETASIVLDITEQKHAEQSARLADQRLRDAIESMPAGFRIFDADERLVLWNSRYMEQSIWHGGHMEAGITFEEILQKTIREQKLADKTETDDEYIRKRVAEFRNPGRTPYEVKRSDGATLLSIYRKTQDGGTVSVVLDITEQKQAEKQAEHERRRLMDSINSLPIGFRLFDRDERLVHTNDRNHSEASWHDGDFEPGATYEEILRRSIEEGLHVHDMESDDVYIASKLREFRNADGEPVERRRSDGRTNLMLFRKTSDGETASIVLDITELKEAERQVLENQQRLDDAIESLPVGFRLFDAEERLLLFNSVQKNMTEWHRDLIKSGVTYEEILRDSVNKGMHLHDFPSDEEYIAHRLEHFRSENHGAIENDYATGRHGQSIHRKTSNGGTVSIEMDVTEQVEAEKRAKDASQRLLDAIESLPAGFCLFNKDEQLVISNSRQRETTPWHGSELRFGATFEDLVRSSVAKKIYYKLDYDDLAAVEDFITNRLADFRNPQGASIELSRNDGTSGLSIFHKTTDGGTVAILFDITERKQTEQALKASEGRLDAILDLAPEAIITTDERYKIQMFNAGAEQLFGFAAGKMTGRDLEVLFAERERGDHDGNGDGQRASVIPAWQLDGRREMIALHESGREIPVEISVAETVADGVRLHTVLLQDISERKRWEDDLRHAMQLADAANRAKSEFLSHMSHELRTPLNGIMGYAEFIRDKWLGEDALEQYVEYAGFISESGQHLLQLINDILDLSKVEAGQYDPVFEDIDVEVLFEECRLIVAAEAEKSSLAIDFDAGSGATHWIADRRAVKQILLNLLSNAMKFSEAGSRIEVRSSRDGAGHYRLKVQDTGIGMTEAEAKRALEPFVQVGRAYVTQNKGTGLGLALVVRLAALHRGTVEIDSEPKQGTTVQVVFPPLPRDTDAAELPDQRSA